MEVHEPAVAPAGRGSSATALLVRRLVTAVMRPQEDITDRLASPDIPSLLIRDPDLARIVRRSSGTVAPDGQPLTATGWPRIRQWRQEWLALPSEVSPAVIGADQVVRSGLHALDYLAHLANISPEVPRSGSRWQRPGRPGLPPPRAWRGARPYAAGPCVAGARGTLTASLSDDARGGPGER